MKYNLVRDNEGNSNITVVVDGEMYVADSNHARFSEIVQKVLADDESVVRLFDKETLVRENFNKVSDRVSVRSGKVYFDLEPVDSALTRQIVRFVDDDLSMQPLVKFMEKIMDNPSENSREQLYSWLADRDFTLTEDGDFIAYKGVQLQNDEYVSINSGTAMVNGVEHNGYIPNFEGAVVEMPRSKVEDNSSVGCSYGLHAGTYEYANSFARGALLKVKINPRDVVSVPTDCASQKLRVCRYVVLEKIEKEIPEALDRSSYYEDDYEDDYGDGDYCDCYDCVGDDGEYD